jgi:type I restriction enzyme S subunit
MIETSSQIPSSFKLTKIGLLPDDWEVVKLKDIAQKMKAGGTPRRKEKKYWNGEIPFVLIKDMTSCGLYLSKTEENITKVGLENSSAWVVPSNSLLLSMYATIGETVINMIPLATNQAILAIIPKPNFDIVFGAYMIKFHTNRLMMQNVQSTQKNVNKGIVQNFEIPLPPLSEQKKIAFVLSTIQKANEKTEAVIHATKELKKSLMKYLFTYGPVPVDEAENVVLKETEVGLIPEKWEVVRLGKASNIIMGQSPPGESYNNDGLGVPLINGPAEFGEKFPKILKWTSNPTKICEKGDILFCVRGNTTGRLNFSDSEYCIGRGVAAICGKDKCSETSYLFCFLEKEAQNILILATSGGSTFPNITKTQINNLPIPLPSHPNQQRIVSILSLIDKKIQTEQAKKEALEQLFKTMLHDLMTGKIRVTHLEVPHDHTW